MKNLILGLLLILLVSGCLHARSKLEPIFIQEPPTDLKEKYSQVLINLDESTNLIKEAITSEIKLARLNLLLQKPEDVAIIQINQAITYVKTVITKFDTALVKNKQAIRLLQQLKSTNHPSLNITFTSNLLYDKLYTELLNKQALSCNLIYLNLLNEYSLAEYEPAEKTFDDLKDCNDKRIFLEEYIRRESWKDANLNTKNTTLEDILKNV